MENGGSNELKVTLQLDGKTLYTVALHLIIVVLGVELFVLARQNEQLKGKQELLGAGSLNVGDMFRVDNLAGVDHKGGLPAERSGRQLIFVFSTKCKFCKENIERWQKVAREAGRRGLFAFAISLDSLSNTVRYVKQNGIAGYEVFVPDDVAKFTKENRIAGVPLTVLRGSLGNVERVWLGVLEAEQVKEILSGISV